MGSQTVDQPGGAPVQEYPEDGGFPGDLPPPTQCLHDLRRYHHQLLLRMLSHHLLILYRQDKPGHPIPVLQIPGAEVLLQEEPLLQDHVP